MKETYFLVTIAYIAYFLFTFFLSTIVFSFTVRRLLAKPRSSTVTPAPRAGQTTRRQAKNGGSQELLDVVSLRLELPTFGLELGTFGFVASDVCPPLRCSVRLFLALGRHRAERRPGCSASSVAEWSEAERSDGAGAATRPERSAVSPQRKKLP